MFANETPGLQFVNLLYTLLLLIFVGGLLYILNTFGYSPVYLLKLVWYIGLDVLKGVGL